MCPLSQSLLSFDFIFFVASLVKNCLTNGNKILNLRCKIYENLGLKNTASYATTLNNIGKGGNGTGAELNTFTNGIAGGSGIVIIKYYT